MKNKLKIFRGCISRLKVDAIICTSTTELDMDNELTKKLIDAGGEDLYIEFLQLSSLEKGEATITEAGKLPAKHLVHAVINEKGEYALEEDLMNGINNSLKTIQEKGLKSIAIPLIGEINGIPIKRAIELILTEIKKYFIQEIDFDVIIFVVDSDIVYNALEEAIKHL